MKLMPALFSAVFLLLSQAGIAADAGSESNSMAVKTMRLEESGQVAPINTEGAAKWLRESIEDAKRRLATELPAILGTSTMEVELVSVPHPESGFAINKMFLQWKEETNAARFIPLIGRAVEQKIDLYVALDVRVSAPEQPPLTFSGRSHEQAEYRKGLRLTSAFLETLNTVGKKLFDEAVDKAIAAAKETSKRQ